MTDAAIKGAGWLSGKLKKQILEFRKKNKSQIKDLTDPKKAAAQKPRFTPREPEWKYSKSAKDAMAGKTKPKPKHKIIDLKTLTPKDKAAAALAVPAIGGGGGAALTLKGRKKKIKKKAGGGKVGMSHQGLYPAEEARAGTMSEMERVKHMKKGKQVKGVKFKDLGKNKVKFKDIGTNKIKFKDLSPELVKFIESMTNPKPKRETRERITRGADRAPVIPKKDIRERITRGPDRARITKPRSYREPLEPLMTPVDQMDPVLREKLGLKKGGQVKKKKKKEQGYKARKDESIAMRVKKKRTKKQLKASRDESYGKFGSKAKKRGKINRSSSKGWDGNTEVSRHYDS